MEYSYKEIEETDGTKSMQVDVSVSEVELDILLEGFGSLENLLQFYRERDCCNKVNLVGTRLIDKYNYLLTDEEKKTKLYDACNTVMQQANYKCAKKRCEEKLKERELAREESRLAQEELEKQEQLKIEALVEQKVQSLMANQ